MAPAIVGGRNQGELEMETLWFTLVGLILVAYVALGYFIFLYRFFWGKVELEEHESY